MLAARIIFLLAAAYCILRSITLDSAHAAPILTPDLSRCAHAVATSPKPGDNTTQILNCCLPYRNMTVVDFSFKRYPVHNSNKKVRRPAHKASAEYIKKYNKAYELMRALPEDDPRSFKVQANIHCAFCNGAYKQRDTDINLQVHFSWFFLPWHRWYLYFHERILASLVGDPSFSLLYWNWDNQDGGDQGNTMPRFFTQKGSAVFDAKRNRKHMSSSQLVRLNVGSNESGTIAASDIVKENLNAMYQSMVTASTADMFMGGPYRTGSNLSGSSVASAPLGGALEMSAHSGIHYWTGDPNRKLRADMGVFTQASRDPIFYAHHSNVDRLWEVWRTISGGRRTDPIDADFLEAEFLFYDENANLVKVKAKDALHSEELGISYEHVKDGDNMWLRFEPQPSPSNIGSQVAYAKTHGVQEVGPASTDGKSKPISIDQNFTALVKRPSGTQPKNYEEVLVIQGLEVTREAYVHLKVFVNMPNATTTTPISTAEYVGSANFVPSPGTTKLLFTNTVLEIGDNLKRLSIEDDDLVVVTLLVDSEASTPGTTTIQGLKIEYE